MSKHLLGLAIGALALLGGCTAAAAPPDETVVIEIEHSRFSEERLQVEAGSTIRFVIDNNDPIPHEFIVGDERVQRVHENGTERHHAPRPGEISIPVLSERITTYTFEEPGELIFGCHLPGHYRFGMRGTIQVVL
ncbi:MAG: cupredoxin domain-containing protein [Actinomycetota bacterium]